MNCPFCSPNAEEILLKNDLCYVLADRYPVSRGHLLVIPFRHVAEIFSLSDDEKRELVRLLNNAKELLDRCLSPDGYNVGVNVGSAGGQTIMHAHVHLIPRYHADVDDPRGGVRGVITQKRVWTAIDDK
ncbi:MAG: hypothetical protein PWQ88_1205 [Candidatus Methanomethylophilaceae archaeon]|nr:hypothetical protein [Candidatus Methanomethylophilaceae archaeon]MDI3541497.1 hypothetical protein [Candidatus Methanomethylophilaceae archaeon]